MHDLILSSSFQKQLNKLIKRNPKLKTKIKDVIKLIKKDIAQPSLKLHKLSGKNNWSISVTRSIRLIIHLEKNKIYCLRIGSHDEVY